MKEAGERISKLRKYLGMTQADLAGKLSVSRELVNLWESNRRQIKGDDVVRLADALQTTCDYLLRGDVQTPAGTKNISRLVSEYTGLTVAAIDSIKSMSTSALKGLNIVLEEMKK